MDKEKKNIIHFTVIPAALLSSMDIITTYLGVCVNDGVELNVYAIRMAQRFGFLAAGSFHVILITAIAGIMAAFLWRYRKNDIARTFVVVTVVLFLTDIANTVILNSNSLLYQEVGTGFAPPDEHAKDVTPSQIQEIEETFERRDFCRLI